MYKNMLKRDKVDVVSITEPIVEGPFGSLIERIIEWMDEYYSIRLSSEVKRGMTEKARRGEIQTIASFGYTFENGKLVPEPREAEIVCKIFQRFIEGEGFYSIARWLNEMGVRTHRGNKFENRTVEYIIRNPVYIGRLRWNPEHKTKRNFEDENIILTDAKHQPIIDLTTWEQAQTQVAMLKSMWKYKGRPITEMKDWPSGIVRCAACNSTLVFENPHYYKCGAYAKGRCRYSQHIKADMIKEAIIEKLKEDYSSASQLTYTIIHKKENEEDIPRLQASLASVERKIIRLREAFLAEIETAEEYKKHKAELSAEAEQIKARIAELESAVSCGDATIKIKEAIAVALKTLQSPDATVIEKHSAANEIIESCLWDKANNLITITYRLAFS
ncbi:MAG: hypothetical protein GX488_07425 [Clostridiales bacterium]|nr:hypothetical protein [Clostridiales bacterium]